MLIDCDSLSWSIPTWRKSSHCKCSIEMFFKNVFGKITRKVVLEGEFRKSVNMQLNKEFNKIYFWPFLISKYHNIIKMMQNFTANSKYLQEANPALHLESRKKGYFLSWNSAVFWKKNVLNAFLVHATRSSYPWQLFLAPLTKGLCHWEIYWIKFI